MLARPPIPRRPASWTLAVVLAAACGGDDGGTAAATDPYIPTTSGGSGPATTTTSSTSTTTGTPGSGGTSTGGTTTGAASTTGPTEPDVPEDIPYCQPVADWDPAWRARELAIVEIVNQHRMQGADCGSRGVFAPTAPLAMQPNLWCAARVHSKDMAERNFFDHVNPDGESPFDRMMKAGYSFFTAGENIAAGNDTAEATMQQWMESDGHCANIMNPDFKEIGVGYHPGGQWGHLWTQAFGG